MAFDNVTFFELHFDGATFGPTSGEDETAEPTAEETPVAAEESSRGPGRVVGLLAFAALVGAAAAMRRRRARGADEGIEIETLDADEADEAVEAGDETIER